MVQELRGEIGPADGFPLPPGDGGTPDEEQTLGDLLLHLHPHYEECMGGEGDDGGEGSGGEMFGYIMDGSIAHIKLMQLFLKTRKIDLKLLHTCIEEVWKLPLIHQFYKMPIYEFLCYKAQELIQHLEGLDWER